MSRFFPITSIPYRILWFIPFTITATVVIVPITVIMMLYGTVILMYGMFTFNIKYVGRGLKMAIIWGPALYALSHYRYIVYGEIDKERIEKIKLLNKMQL